MKHVWADMLVVIIATSIIAGVASLRLRQLRPQFAGHSASLATFAFPWWTALLAAGIAAGFATVTLQTINSFIVDAGADAYRLLIAIAQVVAMFVGAVGVLTEYWRWPFQWAAIIGIVSATGLAAIWMTHPTWLSIDLAAIILAGSLLWQYNSYRLARLLVYFEIGLVGYDVYSVFMSGEMLKLANAALNADRVPQLPILIVIPGSWSVHSGAVIMIGLGDILVPGLLVTLAATFVARGIGRHLHRAGIAGYAVGAVTAIVAVRLTGVAQPATLYLIPATILAIAWQAYHEGVLRQVWGSRRYGPLIEQWRMWRQERSFEARINSSRPPN